MYEPPEGETVSDEEENVPPVSTEPIPKPIKARGQFEYIERSRLVQINFSYLEHDGTIFFQRNDKLAGLTELYKVIDEYVENKENLRPLEVLEPSEMCLLSMDDVFSRARLIRNINESSQQWLAYSLDTGFVDEVLLSDLFETTDAITSNIKFQAMLGRFAGIEPNSPNGYTEAELCGMEEIIKEYKEHLYVRFVHLNNNRDWYQNWGLNFYDLLVVAIPDINNVKILNQVFVDKGKDKAVNLNKKV